MSELIIYNETILTKVVRCYPNIKPWVNSDLKAFVNRKRRAKGKREKIAALCVRTSYLPPKELWCPPFSSPPTLASQYSTESCHLEKFQDDTTIVGCVENGWEYEYRKLGPIRALVR